MTWDRTVLYLGLYQGIKELSDDHNISIRPNVSVDTIAKRLAYSIADEANPHEGCSPIEMTCTKCDTVWEAGDLRKGLAGIICPRDGCGNMLETWETRARRAEATVRALSPDYVLGPDEVEVVRATDHAGAVDDLREVRNLIGSQVGSGPLADARRLLDNVLNRIGGQ